MQELSTRVWAGPVGKALVAFALVAASLLVSAGPADAACVENKTFTTDNATYTQSGRAGWVSGYLSASGDCNDVNIMFTGAGDYYAGHYYNGSWTPSNVGIKYLSAGSHSYVVIIKDLANTTPYRMWSDGYDRVVKTAD